MIVHRLDPDAWINIIREFDCIVINIYFIYHKAVGSAWKKFITLVMINSGGLLFSKVCLGKSVSSSFSMTTFFIFFFCSQ